MARKPPLMMKPAMIVPSPPFPLSRRARSTVRRFASFTLKKLKPLKSARARISRERALYLLHGLRPRHKAPESISAISDSTAAFPHMT